MVANFTLSSPSWRAISATMRLYSLAKLCAALNCQPGDLLEYRPAAEAEEEAS